MGCVIKNGCDNNIICYRKLRCINFEIKTQQGMSGASLECKVHTMFESGGIKMQMCFFVDGSKYTVCKMLDEEAIAIFLPRKPHIFGQDPKKSR